MKHGADARAADAVLEEWMRDTERSPCKDDTTQALRGVLTVLSVYLKDEAPALAVAVHEIAFASIEHEHDVRCRKLA